MHINGTYIYTDKKYKNRFAALQLNCNSFQHTAQLKISESDTNSLYCRIKYVILSKLTFFFTLHIDTIDNSHYRLILKL